jgi:hypothetical protein
MSRSIENLENIKENIGNIKENIGNYLSSYYYELFISILQQKDFEFIINSNSLFIKDLPTKIPYINHSYIYDILQNNNITYKEYINNDPNAFWELNNKKKEIIHQTMKPLMYTIIENALLKSNLYKKVYHTIIHFRCADTPFIRHNTYHFQKYKYFIDAIEEIGNKTIILLTNNTHLSNENQQTSCNIYVSKLSHYLETNGYTVSIQSESKLDDFATLFFAPAVISTSSSFSFMSGYFGNGKYIQPTYYFNNKEICNECSSFIYKGYNIKHEDVINYHDIDNVYKMLLQE